MPKTDYGAYNRAKRHESIERQERAFKTLNRRNGPSWCNLGDMVKMWLWAGGMVLMVSLIGFGLLLLRHGGICR